MSAPASGYVPSESRSPAIAARGLAKRFEIRGWRLRRPRPAVDALRGVDLAVPPGAVHGIIGPNGSGKSTLLRILATLVLPDAGAATVSGADVVTAAMAVRRQLGYSNGDERSVYWRLTARQNLAFAAALQHVPDAPARVEAALATARLDTDADRPVSGFSQGMLRRLGLARALLHAPSVLLLDEPTRSLDPVARDEFHAAVASHRRRGDVTVLVATHDLAEAAELCDEVSVLRDGLVVERLVPTSADALDAELRRLVS